MNRVVERRERPSSNLFFLFCHDRLITDVMICLFIYQKGSKPHLKISLSSIKHQEEKEGLKEGSEEGREERKGMWI